MPAIVIDAPTDKVWKALTTPSLIKQWFFGADTKTDWKVGSPIVHTGEMDGKRYEDKGVIKAFEPNQRLVHSHWSSMSGKPDKPENYETVSYALHDQGGRTEVEVTEENVATKDQEAASAKLWQGALGELKKVAEAA